MVLLETDVLGTSNSDLSREMSTIYRPDILASLDWQELNLLWHPIYPRINVATRTIYVEIISQLIAIDRFSYDWFYPRRRINHPPLCCIKYQSIIIRNTSLSKLEHSDVSKGANNPPFDSLSSVRFPSETDAVHRAERRYAVKENKSDIAFSLVALP